MDAFCDVLDILSFLKDKIWTFLSDNFLTLIRNILGYHKNRKFLISRAKFFLFFISS
jgi:hypothetical protein